MNIENTNNGFVFFFYIIVSIVLLILFGIFIFHVCPRWYKTWKRKKVFLKKYNNFIQKQTLTFSEIGEDDISQNYAQEQQANPNMITNSKTTVCNDMDKNYFRNLSISINLGVVKIDAELNEDFYNVVWVILVELSTKIIFNKLKDNEGLEEKALNSVYKCFVSIRKALSRERIGLPWLYIILSLLNNQMRPFLVKWDGQLKENKKETFRKDLSFFQEKIRKSEEVELLFLTFDIKKSILERTIRGLDSSSFYKTQKNSKFEKNNR